MFYFPGLGVEECQKPLCALCKLGVSNFYTKQGRMIIWYLWSNQHAINRKTISSTRWFKVTFSSPSWRSLNHLKGSLNHPKKVTKNCQIYNFFQTTSMKNLWDTPSIQALDRAGAWVPSGQAKMFLSGFFRASCQMPHVSPVSTTRKQFWVLDVLLLFFEIFTQTNACSQNIVEKPSAHYPQGSFISNSATTPTAPPPNGHVITIKPIKNPSISDQLSCCQAAK